MKPSMRALLVALMSATVLAIASTGAAAGDTDGSPGGGTAPASESDPRAGWSSDVISYIDSDDDAGGYGVRIVLRHPDSNSASAYNAEFDPYDEELWVEDNWTDGRRAVAEVRVYNGNGQLVDTDRFSVGTSQTFDLGTPDGSGNIPEGYGVDVRLCAGSSYCSAWGDGIA